MTVSHPAPSAPQLEALELLRKAQSFLLVGHVRPDGDCIGSQVALARVLVAMGKQVVIMNPDSPGPSFDSLFEGLENCSYGDGSFGAAREGSLLPLHEVCILLDINLLSRTGAMQADLEKAPSRKIVVDHHLPQGPPQGPPQGQPQGQPQGPAWWDAAFIDGSASATGLLVARIACALGVELDLKAAEAVFAAIVTDTGWFKYSNTDPETMALAADLVARGVVPGELYGRFYQQSPPELPTAIGTVLGSLEYACGGRLAVITYPLEAQIGSILDDADPVLDIVRAVSTVEVVVYLREIKGGSCRLSLRSKTDFDVNDLAGQFGGGGHAKASGATIEGDLSDVRERVIDVATQLLQREGTSTHRTPSMTAPIQIKPGAKADQ